MKKSTFFSAVTLACMLNMGGSLNAANTSASSLESKMSDLPKNEFILKEFKYKNLIYSSNKKYKGTKTEKGRLIDYDVNFYSIPQKNFSVVTYDVDNEVFAYVLAQNESGKNEFSISAAYILEDEEGLPKLLSSKTEGINIPKWILKKSIDRRIRKMMNYDKITKKDIPILNKIVTQKNIVQNDLNCKIEFYVLENVIMSEKSNSQKSFLITKEICNELTFGYSLFSFDNSEKSKDPVFEKSFCDYEGEGIFESTKQTSEKPVPKWIKDGTKKKE